MAKVKSLRISISLATLFFLLLSSITASQSASVNGTICSKVGDQLLEVRSLYTCTKVGAKLLWRFTDDNTSKLAPFPLSGLSWLEIARQKEEAERLVSEARAKEAAEQRAKIEQEIAAAAQKARLEAEAKAAKAEADAKAEKAAAEVPKVAGLVIGSFYGAMIFWAKQVPKQVRLHGRLDFVDMLHQMVVVPAITMSSSTTSQKQLPKMDQ